MAGAAPPQPTASKSVQRALALLRCFDAGPTSRSLTELAAQAGLAPSTAHRHLRALCDAGLLRQDAVTEHYGLGPALVALGLRAADALGLAATRPVLEALADTTGESVNLGVRDADDVLVVVGVPSAQRLRFDQEEGTRVPAYASAMGKVLLAFDGDPDAVVRSLPRLAKLTGSTITSRTKLRQVLDDARRRGWAINDQERDPGVRTVAVPVLGPDGAAVAAVAVQGPALRMTDDRIEQVLHDLRSSAAEVAGRLAAGGA